MKIDIFDTKNKYDIIYADPPWKCGGSGGTKWYRADNYYPTMSYKDMNEIAQQINNISSDNSLLFLWVVSPELPRCIAWGESCGFKYITVGFVWYKERANVGNYTMSGCELCLIFKKGKIPADRVRNPGTKQFLSEPITRHSAKPAEFRKRITQMFPLSKKIELFARTGEQNWDCWGFDAPDVIENGEIL